MPDSGVLGGWGSSPPRYIFRLLPNVSKISQLTPFDPFSLATDAQRQTTVVESFVVVRISREAGQEYQGKGLAVEQDDVTPSEQESSQTIS